MQFNISFLHLCTIVFCVSNRINGYKILGVFPFAMPSHYFLGNELLKGLAEAGHDVTMMTVFEEKSPPANGKYKQILMEDLVKPQKELFMQLTNLGSQKTKSFFSNPFTKIPLYFFIGNAVAEMTLNNTKIQQMIKSKEQFDLLIVPQFFIEALKALAPPLGAHLVVFNSVSMNSWMGHFVGNPSIASVDPEIIIGYTGAMNFKQRILNTLFKVMINLYIEIFSYPTEKDLVHKYISKDIDLREIQYNVSLVLSNSHSSLNGAMNTVPVIKEIGGFHVRSPKKLPKALQKYLDGAKGVIYFSMGSNLKGTDLPPEIRRALMEAFSKRKEKVLWKFEDDDMPGKPDNVRIEKWLPQSDILAHPNVKLFITHGGFLSTIETVYHGVPTLAIPIFGDQLKNAKTAELDGYTLVLEFKNLNETLLTAGIEEVLSNKKYAENAKYRSKIFHDRQIKPLDEAVYWVEYIVRYEGAKHLRVNYLDMSWFKYILLDVVFVVLGALFLLLFILRKIICAVLSTFRKKNAAVSKKKKKL